MQRDLDPNQPLGQELLTQIGIQLSDFLDRQAPLLAEIGVEPLLELSRSFTVGGKRLRPAFCYWSYVAAAGFPSDPAALLRAAASLDLLHVSALIHDDLIDHSDTRRGIPAAHRQFQARHIELAGRGQAEEFGKAAAILLGDLLLMWSLELFDDCGLPETSLRRARGLLATMRTEVTCGQFLDLSAASQVTGAKTLAAELETAQRVLEYKSARYSVRRPAQLGAALAGAAPDLDAALAEFGSRLGRAFQLRDDVLGIFGDPQLTGKPAGDDIGQGKRTSLVLTALQRADQAAHDKLEQLLGCGELTSEQVAAAQQVILDSGALQAVEELIAADAERALGSLAKVELTDAGRTALLRLTELSVTRDR